MAAVEAMEMGEIQQEENDGQNEPGRARKFLGKCKEHLVDVAKLSGWTVAGLAVVACIVIIAQNCAHLGDEVKKLRDIVVVQQEKIRNMEQEFKNLPMTDDNSNIWDEVKKPRDIVLVQQEKIRNKDEEFKNLTIAMAVMDAKQTAIETQVQAHQTRIGANETKSSPRVSQNACPTLTELTLTTPANSRIIGGEPASDSFMAVIRYWGTFRCQGTVLDNGVLLTSAHCFISSTNPRKYSVLLGQVDLDGEGGVIVPVKKILLCPDYDHVTHENDCAMVVTERFEYTNRIQPLALAGLDSVFLPGDIGAALGWGQTNETGPPHSRTLQKVEIIRIDTNECKKLWPGRPLGGMFCTANLKGNEGPCKGDGGGPIIAMDQRTGVLVQHGIISWGPESCGEAGKPHVHIEVIRHLDFFQSVIDDNSNIWDEVRKLRDIVLVQQEKIRNMDEEFKNLTIAMAVMDEAHQTGISHNRYNVEKLRNKMVFQVHGGPTWLTVGPFPKCGPGRGCIAYLYWVNVNYGNHYNPSTGTYTVPFSGLWAISINGISTYGDQNPSIFLSKNDNHVNSKGIEYLFIWLQSSYWNYAIDFPLSAERKLWLRKGDRLTVRFDSPSMTLRTLWWGGYLLREDF